jgi:Putative metal-binding motif
VRVVLADGGFVERSLRITIDNTAPTVGGFPASLRAGDNVELSGADDNQLAGFELRSSAFPGQVFASTGGRAPYLMVWPGPCGDVEVQLRAIDRAGNWSERRYPVASADRNDYDCDGHRAANVAYGDDCDDGASWIHPGASEPPEGSDLNCDGQIAKLAGLDFDRDGVASFSDGGDDCDDTDASIHGNFLAFEQRLLRSGGTLLSWDRGEAALLAPATLALNRAGVVESAWLGASDATLEQVATGANAESIGVAPGFVAFGRGDDVVVMRRDVSAWVPYTAIAAGARVGKLTLAAEVPSDLRVVFQAGTEVWLAAHAPDGTWTKHLLVNALAPLSAPPSVVASGGEVLATFHTAQNAWRVSYPITRIPVVRRLGPSGLPITAAVAGLRGPFAVAVVNNSGSSVFLQDMGDAPPTRALSFAQTVVGLHMHEDLLFVELNDGPNLVVRMARSPRVAQVLPDRWSLAVASDGSFAQAGLLRVRGPSTVLPPFDGQDGVDRDCDGSEY